MTNEQKQKLENLSTNKLIDVVKNYRQYGYDEQLREYAIIILESRGITKDELKLTGNFENRTFDYVIELYNSFKLNSKLALIMYMIILGSLILIPILRINASWFNISITIIVFLSFLLFFLFIILSFIDQNKFYKAIGKKSENDAALVFTVGGSFIYMFTYFYIRDKMKKQMNEIK